MKIQYFLILIFLPFFCKAQGGLIIGSGASMVVSGTPQIVIKDGEFTNDGEFIAGSSTLYLTGNTAIEHSTIGGTTNTTFNNLTISKSSNDVRLDYDIQINGDLLMDGGLLFLNHSDIVLEGVILGETELTRITGTSGGAIIKTLPLNMPAAANPGNMGAEITAAADLGNTIIRRSHVQQDNGGATGIFRYYDIIPDNNSDVDATLRFHYFDAELDGLSENELQHWQQDVDWESLGSEDNDTNENWVEVSGMYSFHRHTLAVDMNAPLPIELLNFQASVNENKQVDLFWITSTEINNEYFIVERSKDGVQFEPIAQISGAGNSFQPLTYQAIDKHPFAGTSYYRLRQTDFDGTTSLSVIKAVHIELNQLFTVYPNPLREVLHVVGDGTIKGKMIVEIFDALGNQKYHQVLDMDEELTTIEIKEVATFIAGTYFLTIQTAKENYTFNLVKVSE